MIFENTRQQQSNGAAYLFGFRCADINASTWPVFTVKKTIDQMKIKKEKENYQSVRSNL